ncbi:MAG TPA: hypothetical protein PLW86_12690 [Rhodocyclaceae bacterium]|nr:hypothetical protein [Rhodocyclaceae bacterium]
MRSTRAAAAVARLNTRCPGQHYVLAMTGDGLFKLRERSEAGEQQLGEALALDDFVRFVNGLGPQTVARVTKNDAAFATQLARKPKA